MNDETRVNQVPSGITAEEPISINDRLRLQGDTWMLVPGGGHVDTRRKPGITPALENGIAIVAYINRRAPSMVSLSEVSSALGISRSHCHSLLKTLVHYEWLGFDDATKTYRLMAGVLSDTSSLLDSASINVIRAEISKMVEILSLPCVLSEPLSDDSFVVIDRFNARHIMGVSFPVGHRFPKNAPAQMRAYLAWQAPEALDRWMQDWQPAPYTPQSLVDRDAVRAEIEATRVRGYSRSVGEFTEGLMAMALPIFNKSGYIDHVFNVSSLVGMLLPREEEVAKEMQRTVSRIHHAIGARIPADFPRLFVSNGGFDK